MKKASAISTGTRVLVQVFLLALVVGSLLPLYNVIVASLKSADEFAVNPFFPPKSPVSDNFVYAAVNARLLTTRSTASFSFPAAWCCTLRCASPRAMRSGRCGSA